MLVIIAGLFYIAYDKYNTKTNNNDNNSGNNIQKDDTKKDDGGMKVDTNKENTPYDIDEVPTYAKVDLSKYSITNTKKAQSGYLQNYSRYKNGKVVFSAGSYTCKNKSAIYCDVAEIYPEYVADVFNLRETTILEGSSAGIVMNRYVLVRDSVTISDSGHNYSATNPIYLIDLKTQQVVGDYTAVKRSLLGFDDTDYYTYFILRDTNNKFGVITFDDGKIVNLVPFEYDYIGDIGVANKFMVVNDKVYYVYDTTSAKKNMDHSTIKLQILIMNIL